VCVHESLADCDRGGFDLALVMGLAMGVSSLEGRDVAPLLIAERRRWMSAMSSSVLGRLL
jgi:hypothetical protein